jgi:site-specific recombinase XerD
MIDMILGGIKTEAKQAEAEKRKELKNPKPVREEMTDITFLDLVNLRLDHVKTYNSANHYRDVLYHARRWVKEWEELPCKAILSDMIERFLIKRNEVSSITANKELQYLRALFNYGLKRKLINESPCIGIDFFPIEKKKKYFPSKEDVFKVISAADPDTQQYLWTILLTAGRVTK